MTELQGIARIETCPGRTGTGAILLVCLVVLALVAFGFGQDLEVVNASGGALVPGAKYRVDLWTYKDWNVPRHVSEVFTLMQMQGAAIPLASGGIADEWSPLSVPEYASDVQKVTILRGTARQVSFVVNEPYPFDGVHDFYIAHLPDTWRVCSSRLTGWQAFIDGTRNPEVYVHQRLVHWVDYSRDRLLILRLRYESEMQANGSFFLKPPNSPQLVVLVEYKEAGVESLVDGLEIQCAAAKPGV